jgi:hypothetical protein
VVGVFGNPCQIGEMKMKVLLTVAAIGLLSSTASAADFKWSPEELEAGFKRIEIVRYAFAGIPIKVNTYNYLNADCSPTEGWHVEIIKQPEHGTAEIVKTEFFTTYAKDNPRFKCNETKSAGVAITYKADAGYAGKDQFTFLDVNATGFASEFTYILNVRSSAADKAARK